MRNGERDRSDGLLGLARETADALGLLMVQHIRLARLELKADLRAMGLQAALMAVLVALAMVGYGLTMAGLAILLGGGTAGGVPLLVIGLVHMAVAGMGILVAALRLRRVRLMNTTADEVKQSLSPLGLGTATEPEASKTGEAR
jgi:hypothetical protein